jgi:hypothetical protein
MKGPQIRLPCRRQCRRCHTRNAEQDFSFARLVSITSWRNVNGSVLLDQDATPLEVVRASYVQHDKDHRGSAPAVEEWCNAPDCGHLLFQ